MLAGAAVVLYMRIDQVMLRHLAGEEEAGIYAVAVRLSEAVYFVPAIVVTGLLPFWSAARQRGGRDYEQALQGIFDLQTALALGFALPVTFASGAIVTAVFGPDYAAAGPVLAVHVWAGIFVFQGTARSQAWVFEDWNRLTLVTTVAGAACNVLLNYLWIPRHGAMGAAAATLVAYGVAAWGASFCFRRTRRMAWLQTKALLLPVFGWRYLFRHSSHAGPL
jgi:O-antigen/teichoic acid export membrane protein